MSTMIELNNQPSEPDDINAAVQLIEATTHRLGLLEDLLTQQAANPALPLWLRVTFSAWANSDQQGTSTNLLEHSGWDQEDGTHVHDLHLSATPNPDQLHVTDDPDRSEPGAVKTVDRTGHDHPWPIINTNERRSPRRRRVTGTTDPPQHHGRMGTPHRPPSLAPIDQCALTRRRTTSQDSGCAVA